MGFYQANEPVALRTLCGTSEAVTFYAKLTGDATDAEPALRKAFSLFRNQRPKRPIPLGRAYRYYHMVVETRFIVLFSLIQVLLVAGKAGEARELAQQAQLDLSSYRFLDPKGRLAEPMAAVMKSTM